MIPYRILPLACEDIRLAIDFYEKQSSGLGSRFLDEFEAVISRIQTHPEAWTPVDTRQRRCMFRAFPFAVLYAVHTGELVVTAVMDLRMDPETSRRRLDAGF